MAKGSRYDQHKAEDLSPPLQVANGSLFHPRANVKHFFTLLGKMFFTPYGKEFFTSRGKQFFTLPGKQFFYIPVSPFGDRSGCFSR